MSEQHAQGADAVVNLNNELKTRRRSWRTCASRDCLPNDFRRDHSSNQLHAEFDGKENEELEALNIEVAVAGRMMARRIMGKASSLPCRMWVAAFKYTMPRRSPRRRLQRAVQKMGPW